MAKRELTFDEILSYLEKLPYKRFKEVYEDYCNLFDVTHYIKPSNYSTVLNQYGYETPDYSNSLISKQTEEKNQKVLEGLFKDDMIDYISNRGIMLYEEFHLLKKTTAIIIKCL